MSYHKYLKGSTCILAHQQMKFTLESSFSLTEDQRRATSSLVAGMNESQKFQTLLGVTGSGKTFTMASVIQEVQKPTLIISHNKTLAWQLYQEFKEFFPTNEVHYFVSYYDYYQPEAYLPSTDTYIEKDAKINDVIDKLRHSATQGVLTRDDVIVVSSVSCIYNIGDPETYREASYAVARGQSLSRQQFMRELIRLKYERNDYAREPGTFEAKGERVVVYAPTGEANVAVQFSLNQIEELHHSKHGVLSEFTIFPAKHFVTREENLDPALSAIRAELDEQLALFERRGKVLEAARLEQRTNYDLEMLRETGYVSGIENYSRHLSQKSPGAPPDTLLNYFTLRNRDFLVFVDESHMTLPQIRGMYNGDRARKEVLVEHGFRLPSALDNRPLMFSEWVERVPRVIFVSATPGDYEYEHSRSDSRRYVAEQLLRPTHILDPEVEVRPTERQVNDLTREIEVRISRGERVLVTVITKRLAEDLAEHLSGKNIRAAYLHSDVHTLDRPEILNNLRRGEVDVLVGINLLREGLDLPEVSLVAILDADKEGFLRNETTLIQTMGRAARHPNGKVVMYADSMTDAMKHAISETERRREHQREYNTTHNLTPQPITKRIAPKRELDIQPEREWIERLSAKELRAELKRAVNEWDFERAILVRDALEKLS
jgi:excinuclease ABC subunit B